MLLLKITLKSASRRLGTAHFKRGQSFTLPIDADVSKYRAQPDVWEVTTAAGVLTRQAAIDQIPKALKSAKVQAAYTGAINRIKASADAVERLSEPEGLAFLAMVKANSVHFGAHLSRLLSLPVESMVEFCSHLDECRDHWEESVRERLEDTAADLVPEPVPPPAPDPALPEIPVEPAAVLEPDPANPPQATFPEVTEPRGGSEADEGEPAPLEPAPTAPTTPEPSSELAELQQALIGFGENDTPSMAALVRLAQAAGLDVPADVRKIRKRVDMAARVSAILAESLSQPDPLGG